jgi:hypothetical protein
LKDHRGFAKVWREASDITIAEENFSRGRVFESRDTTEQGGLTTARGAEEEEELTLLDGEVDPLEGDVFAGAR